MKTNLKLVAGGVAGMLTAVALVVGMLVWASAEDAASRTSHARAAAEETPAPVPMPSLDNELATTHRGSSAEPPPPEPVLLEEIDPFEPELDLAGNVRVERLVLATGIRNHEPSGAADEFEIGGQSRLYAFVHAVNESGEDVALDVTFEPEMGESSGHVSLHIPAHRSRFRTWAYTRHVYTPGRWHVVVRAADGHVVARRAFDVVEG